MTARVLYWADFDDRGLSLHVVANVEIRQGPKNMNIQSHRAEHNATDPKINILQTLPIFFERRYYGLVCVSSSASLDFLNVGISMPGRHPGYRWQKQLLLGRRCYIEAAETSCIISEAFDMDGSCDIRSTDFRNDIDYCMTGYVVVDRSRTMKRYLSR